MNNDPNYIGITSVGRWYTDLQIRDEHVTILDWDIEKVISILSNIKNKMDE